MTPLPSLSVTSSHNSRCRNLRLSEPTFRVNILNPVRHIETTRSQRGRRLAHIVMSGVFDSLPTACVV